MELRIGAAARPWNKWSDVPVIMSFMELVWEGWILD